MEQRLIDVNTLLNSSCRITGSWDLGNGRKQDFESISVKEIEAAPTIDPVHAAGACYCRDCEYRKFTYGASEVKGYLCASKLSPCRNRIVSPTDFCCYGERETEKK